MKEVRTRIDVRCSKKEKELIEELARDRGLTVSEFIREKLFGRKMTVRYLDRGQGEREIKEV
ncbi:MAG: hypothetical protein RLZZ181_1005 [Pseudomonadota bacterium]|jgi:hypothetical protein